VGWDDGNGGVRFHSQVTQKHAIFYKGIPFLMPFFFIVGDKPTFIFTNIFDVYHLPVGK